MASGEGYTNIEAEHGAINDICVAPGSGLLFVGGDFTQVRAAALVAT